MIYLSMDVDWAPDWAIRQAVDLITSRGLAVTVFITHDSPVIRQLADEVAVERALHPNFLPGTHHGKTDDEVLDYVMALCPEARGVRAHGLRRGTSYIVNYGQRKLTYESSDLLFLQPGLTGGRYWNGVAQLPLWWEDDVHMLHQRPMRLNDIPLAQLPPLGIFDFHPILVALNAADLRGYDQLKKTLSAQGRGLTSATEADVAPFVDTTADGNRTLLIALCDWCVAHRDHGRTTLSAAAEALS